MSCLAVFHGDSRTLEVFGAFGDKPSLADRGKADGVGDLYIRLAKSGLLKTYPGEVTDAALFFRDMSDRYGNVRMAGGDEFRKAEINDVVSAANLPWDIHWQGRAKEVAYGIRAFQRVFAAGDLTLNPNGLLENAIAGSVLRFTPDGNPILDKSKNRARIDALTACCQAVGLWFRHRDDDDGPQFAVA